MSPEIVVALAGVFVAVCVGVGTATSWVLAQNAPERKRLRAVTAAGSTGLVVEETLTETPDPLLQQLSRLLPKSPKDMSRLQRTLTRAGYPSARAAVYFTAAQVLVPFVVFLAVVIFLGPSSGLGPGLVLAAAGYLAPKMFIRRRTAQRQKAIRNGLPDALDLITVCMEAGSGLDQAIARATDELMLSHPVLAEEVRMITTEVRAGKPRLEAFKNFAARTDIPDVRSLVSMLVQTDRFGTSIAEALRVHSDTSRTKRRQAAEERAGKVGVKLVFPLVLCLFPALYVVCFGPVVVKVYRAFF
jgi:tight adherence protein C